MKTQTQRSGGTAAPTVRKVCFVITSEIHYARSKLLLKALERHPGIELQLVVGGSSILPNYGDVVRLMARDGRAPDAQMLFTIEGGNAFAMAKTTGVGIIDFTNVFANLAPDIVLLRADRYELLSAAIAATYMNIPVAHIEGGDITGTIDESVRHAITKLSHLHFTTNEASRRRVCAMGEDPAYVFDVGALEVEFIAQNNFTVSNEEVNAMGVGDIVDIEKQFFMVMYHPVTTEVEQLEAYTELLLNAVHGFHLPTIWFWPNVDAGTDQVAKTIRRFREQNEADHMRFIKYLPPEQFYALLRKTACLIGNSSSGIKEGSYYGTPVVNIGSRQQGRLRGDNVRDVQHDEEAIVEAIRAQLAHGAYPESNLYYQEGTSEAIAEKLARAPLYVQKRFYEERAS